MPRPMPTWQWPTGNWRAAEAMTAAQQGIEIAQANGDEALAKSIADWLAAFRASRRSLMGNRPVLKKKSQSPSCVLLAFYRI